MFKGSYTDIHKSIQPVVTKISPTDTKFDIDLCRQTFGNIFDIFMQNLKNEVGLTDEMIINFDIIEETENADQEGNLDTQFVIEN